MSVRTLSRVWEHSRNKGNDLLMLLAIADFADDDGKAYPAVATLAKKCRMKPRNAQYIIRALEASGELAILGNQGPHGANLYRIKFESLGVQILAGVQEFAGVQERAPGGANLRTKPLQERAPKPSLTVSEPSTGDDGFPEFWKAYPRKVGKESARKAWRKVKPSAAVQAIILQAIATQKRTEQWQKNAGQYIPHPSTWLNDRRWEDEAPHTNQASTGNDVFAGAL
jgi:hypothetical protein